MAQLQAEKLQAQARSEIVTRLFRGFPSGSMDLTVQKLDLSPSDPNVITVDLAYSYKRSFVAALEQTLKTFSIFERSFKRGMIDMSGAMQARDFQDHAMICLGRLSMIRCFALPPGDYCVSCDLQDAGGSWKDFIIFGKFVDAAGLPAGNGCIQKIVSPRIQELMIWARDLLMDELDPGLRLSFENQGCLPAGSIWRTATFRLM